jgi:hypothetical protein
LGGTGKQLVPDGHERRQGLPQVILVDDAALKRGEFAPSLSSAGGALLEEVVQFTDASHEGRHAGAPVGDGVDT